MADNTGYLIYNYLKKVSNDGLNTPLDINNRPVTESGLAQHIIINNGTEVPIQKEYDTGQCPLPIIEYTVSAVSSPIQGGITLVDGVSEKTIVSGTNVQLTAEELLGWEFLTWSDGNINRSRTVTIISDIIYTALYTPIVHSEEILINGLSLHESNFPFGINIETVTITSTSDWVAYVHKFDEINNNWITLNLYEGVAGNTQVTLTTSNQHDTIFPRNANIYFMIKNEPAMNAIWKITNSNTSVLTLECITTPLYDQLSGIFAWNQTFLQFKVVSTSSWEIYAIEDVIGNPITWLDIITRNGTETSEFISNGSMLKYLESYQQPGIIIPRGAVVKIRNLEGLDTTVQINQWPQYFTTSNMIGWTVINPLGTELTRNILSDGEVCDINIAYTSNWEVFEGASSNWYMLDTLSTNNGEYENYTIKNGMKLYVQPNTTNETRTGIVRYKLKNNHNAIITLTFTQPANEYLIINGQNIDRWYTTYINHNSHDLNITINTNIDIDYRIILGDHQVIRSTLTRISEYEYNLNAMILDNWSPTVKETIRIEVYGISSSLVSTWNIYQNSYPEPQKPTILLRAGVDQINPGGAGGRIYVEATSNVTTGIWCYLRSAGYAIPNLYLSPGSNFVSIYNSEWVAGEPEIWDIQGDGQTHRGQFCDDYNCYDWTN